MDMKKTGALIAERRKEMQMTQKELALKLNVTDKAVSKWERGIGYPEITTIPLLAELLGVSASEIMLGEQAKPSCDKEAQQKNITQTDTIVSSTAEYMEYLQEQKVTHAKDIAFVLLSAVLFIGTFVCGLCNYVISATFSWSLLVLGGAVLIWVIVTPWLKCGKYRCFFSLAGLSVAIVPFLLLIQFLSSKKNWVIPFALPIVIVSLASLWIFALLITRVKMRPANRVALAMVLFGVADNLVIHSFVGHYLELSSIAQTNPSSVIVAITCGFLAVALFVAATFSPKKN